MDYEIALNQALDLLADGEQRRADRLLQGIIDHAKARLSGTPEDLERHYFWGRALTAMEEPEQALLRFERALQIDPAHEPSLWETASIFLHELDKPESARVILAEKLLPVSPDNALYRESLRVAEFALRLQKEPPGPGPRTGPAADGPPAAPARDPAAEKERAAALEREAKDLLRAAGLAEPEDEIV
jgi:tetratricopeptide (TPR) repeat protein